jgi:molybdopterin/thiamine biosynthesis adenylyltransferase
MLSIMENRYKRNHSAITAEENVLLAKKKVFIAGCGGLGGYILEMMLRIGVGHIVVADPDDFDETNLNRQLLWETLLGYKKTTAAIERASLINSGVNITAYHEKVCRENVIPLCSGSDLIMDGLDSFDDRIILEEAAEELGIPLVHGAIAGWYGQVCVVFPGDKSLSHIYGRHKGEGIEKGLGNPSFTPAVIAGIQVSEAIKVLLGKPDILRFKLLHIDLMSHSYSELD